LKHMSRGLATLAVLVVVLGSAPANASLIWSIDLHDIEGTVTSVQTVVIRGTLTNSISSTEKLGVIGGFLGVPSGYDYEVGGFARLVNSYSFSWGGGSNSLTNQFEGLDLAPGETFDFVFGTFSPTGPVALDTYSGWFQLQLFESSADRPMVGAETDSYSWTVTRSVPEPGTLVLLGFGLAYLGVSRRLTADWASAAGTDGGKLLDASLCSAEFRTFLASVPSKHLQSYADKCLSDSFDGPGLALQDIVNEVGARLGAVAEAGRYRGTTNTEVAAQI
jgi:PEP-CTERM motif